MQEALQFYFFVYSCSLQMQKTRLLACKH